MFAGWPRMPFAPLRGFGTTAAEAIALMNASGGAKTVVAATNAGTTRAAPTDTTVGQSYVNAQVAAAAQAKVAAQNLMNTQAGADSIAALAKLTQERVMSAEQAWGTGMATTTPQDTAWFQNHANLAANELAQARAVLQNIQRFAGAPATNTLIAQATQRVSTMSGWAGRIQELANFAKQKEVAGSTGTSLAPVTASGFTMPVWAYGLAGVVVIGGALWATRKKK